MEVAASITSGDIGRLVEMAVIAEAGRADRNHVDIEDGVFIPTFTVGPSVVSSVRRATRLPLEVHLQTVGPERWIALVADGGADLVIVHAEGSREARRMIHTIRDAGRGAGLALLPATPIGAVDPLLELVDQVTLMSAAPTPESPFNPTVLEKARALQGRVKQIELDGGVSPEVMRAATRAGVTVVVAGRAVFAKGPHCVTASIAALRSAVGC